VSHLLCNSDHLQVQTGAGTSASRIGHADLGIANLNDMRENAEMIANLDDQVPLIADADTGYGGKRKGS
jgi:2-methylisocitrate lyase-like PEP mutase family enzyme